MKPSRRRMIRLVLSHAGMAASGVGLLLSAAIVAGAPLAQSETEPVAADTLLVMPTVDGEPLSLRSGPALDQPIVASLVPYEALSLLGAAHLDGSTRWLPVKTGSNQVGWISDQYVVVVGASLPALSPSPEVAPAESPTPPPMPWPELLTAPVSVTASVPDVAPAEVRPPQGRPLEVEAKLKFPEAKGRHQEVTIWVTRDGVPVSGATVTIFTEDDDDEPLRVLEPTNPDGRTRREFAIGRKKGSIELVVSAVAPDGGAGRTSVSYFRR